MIHFMYFSILTANIIDSLKHRLIIYNWKYSVQSKNTTEMLDAELNNIYVHFLFIR